MPWTPNPLQRTTARALIAAHGYAAGTQPRDYREGRNGKALEIFFYPPNAKSGVFYRIQPDGNAVQY
jgi:hypothetical protein